MKQSVLGFNYTEKFHDERLATHIYQRFGISEILSKILASKNIPADEIENFLDPKIKNILPDPFDLLDMKLAVDSIFQAISQNKKITIFADYDVDGATSSAILKRFFQEIKVNAEIYVPDRVLEGYGPNTNALLNLKKNGSDLVITVDCGTVAFQPLEAAKQAGLDIIVIDHHLGVLEKPAAIAVINPNRIDETFPHKNLCAAGVVFLLVVALNKKLRNENFYEEKNISEPNLFNLLDLVALGTVCDVMTLTGLNRAFVASGLKILKQRKNIGLRTISDLAKLNEEPTSYYLGFIIGPRINAGGRVGKSDLGATILSTQNEFQANEIAAQLEELNLERKNIEIKALEEAVNQVEKNPEKKSVIFAVGNWHVGVIGIVASRLKDIYNKPVAVISLNEKKGKASCRSINGIDFGAEILKARLNGLLIDGGGHAMAGGFSVEAEKINSLHDFFCANLHEKIQEINAQRKVEFDLALDLAQVNLDLLKELSKLEPFGVGNSRPKFILENLYKIKANQIGKNQDHISCIFSSKSALGFSSQIQAVAFKPSKEISAILLGENSSKPISLVGSININSWMGVEKLQMIIEDVII